MPEKGRDITATDRNRELLGEKIKWLMLFRVAVATILLAIGVIVQFKEKGTILNSLTFLFYPLAGIVFFLSLVYVPLLKRARDLLKIAHIQVVIDIWIITIVVYISGGASSPLSFLYILTVIASTIISYSKGGYWAASLSSILYGGLVNLEYYNVLPSMSELLTGVPEPMPSGILYNTASNIAAFYLVAFLSGYIAAQAKRVEEELLEKRIDYQALEALNNDIVRNISSGLMTVDNDGVITSFNSAAERITGYSLEEVYGKKVHTLFPGFKDKLHYGKPSGPKEKSRWEIWFTRRDGKEHYLGFSLSPLMGSEGERIGEIIIFQDLTELKRMERELKKADRLAAVGRFAAGIAHEIRNPLAAISGSIEMLKNMGGGSGDARLMGIVLREVERLNALITEFLRYARPSEPNREMMDMNALIGEAVELFSNSGKGKRGIRIDCRFGDLPPLSADRSQMKQVIWNLLTNAAEAVNEGGRIEIETTAEVKDGGGTARIVVRDDGCGIPPEIVEKIFDPFYTTKERGTGLGLSIVYNILEAHGASLDVTSRQGEGSTFTIVIPL